MTPNNNSELIQTAPEHEPDCDILDDPYRNVDVTTLPLYQSAPKEIHICVSEEGILGHLEPWNESINENASWCEDAAVSTTVRYVRADLVPQWQPIEEMPEEWKDMRDIILLAGGQMEVGFFGVGSKDWCNADGELESQPTHYLTGIPTPPASKEGE